MRGFLAGIVIEHVFLISMLRKETYENENAFGNGIELAPSSSAVSYLSDRGIEAARAGDCVVEKKLPAWWLRVVQSGRDVGVSLAYDVKDGGFNGKGGVV